MPPAALAGFAGDPRIRTVTHEENRGLAAARNTGVRGASADLIVTLDGDDMLEPQYLERVLPHFEDDGVNCVYTDFELVGDRHGRIAWGGSDPATLLRHQWIPGPGATYRRSLWEAAGGYCEDDVLRVGDEDRDFWISAMEAGLHPLHVAEPLYQYRVGHASMMTRLDESAWRTHKAIYERHRDSFRRHRVGGAFLADGYLRSARASRAAGRRREAVRLAARAIRHQPLRLDGYGVIGRAALPTPLHGGMRTLRRRGRPGADSPPTR